jgi:hypothetical protein
LTKTFSRGLVLAAGLLGVVSPADPDIRPAEMSVQTDPRLLRIQEFFAMRECPAHAYAADFVIAADQNDLDWRLLPSISMVESTGGKESKNNNIFGWDNANKRFRTKREGIYRVAARLKSSPFYRNKDVAGILRTYNPRVEYTARVRAVMNQLGPANLAPEGIF